ncbi:MAG: 1-(5-phosphoribosyl)-5-[(5-phosphoribosylamino)methylideneamino]imidazole-4-carboxamide isomerase [Actinomycetota bacterium]|nr:1-(5-phosphoribosyl)-5-[(5-phosphoribosylamino)methylideneamino]imidazole-4-carboxamide isomerase [Actinomycetota bacterium]
MSGAFELYPAIDLRGGRCVRLYQGDYGKEQAYGTDPVEAARHFAAAGARWIHVVDLDAARTGEPVNRGVVAGIAAAVRPAGVHVQAGGGVRDQASAEALFAAGVDRVVLGTAAVEHPELVRELAADHPVAVGLDARNGEVAIRGWTEGSGRKVTEVLAEYEDAGVAAVVVTQIERDGTLTGPDVDGLAAVLEATSIEVIASGGVSSLADLEALGSLRAGGGGRRLAGVIVGKALHDGLFSVEEAVTACAASA